MRRECGTQEDYVKWLKSLGCVFYAPMTQADGLKDLISGKVGEIPTGNSNCTVTYDNSIGMWVIDNRGGYYAGVWWTGLDMFPNMVDGVSLMREQPMTMFCTLKIITNPTSNYYNVGMALGGGNNAYNSNVSTGASRSVANYLCPYPTFGMRAADPASRIGCKRDGLVFEYIKDGSAISHSDNDPWSQVYYDRFGQRLSLAFRPSNAGARSHFAIKDVLVFNRALSSEVIAMLHE